MHELGVMTNPSVISKACAFVFLKITNHAILLPSLLPLPTRRMPQPNASSRPPPRLRTRPRRATAERRLRILERLTAGVSVAAVACAEGLTARRVRQIIAEALASREVDTPVGFIPLQIGRLGDAMRAAHAKMMAGDLQALDRVVTIVGELDRYHGFGQAGTAVASPLARPAAQPAQRKFSALQPADNTR